ncbi:alpha/beta hydrolase fold-3 [Cordyceps fumosorosea ARSEF 2679]|uniref:Alpha/beta hydrolase fold-3 n=1 Tax=Cordyceps fumosorosea (strain ARSEF 2679) TaxID=1081104 RepID=A0A167LRW1_CORFA|nr:alpha/beta hydrolase fold-3 [Cordyceps fumosorosea ARSEF 2679]OAA53423.1 alpha/beta hydrolase fold-3 [Cordyceps fumosorosea ARSEF 2679]
MIFEPHSLLDHAVTVGIITPQVIRQAGPIRGTIALLKLLFIFFPKATLQLVWTRYLTARKNQPLYVQQANVSEDFALRLLRWSAASLHPRVLRAITGPASAAHIVKWRAYRNGYAKYDEEVQEKVLEEGPERTEGIWVRHDKTKRHDIILLYMHGGGYAVLSAKFYLEFQLALQSSLLEAGYENPAVFSLDYTLAPDKHFPGQLNEAVLAYKEVLAAADAETKICVGGDSAGGMLTLTLLQDLAARRLRDEPLRHPDLALLISPWVTLKTHLHRASSLDYIQPDTLARFADMYTGGGGVGAYASPASPGSCQDEGIWNAARPERGYVVTYGEEEGLRDDIKTLIRHQEARGVPVRVLVDKGGVHVWPVISLQFCTRNERRVQGIRSIVKEIRNALA